MIAKIILNKNSNIIDSLYDYLIPDKFENIIRVGQRVKVGFGSGNKKSEGFIYEISDKSEYTNLKEIIEIIDEYSYFDRDRVDMIEFMRHRYFCSYSSALKVMIPPGLSMKFSKIITLNKKSADDAKLYASKSVIADRIISTLEAYGSMSLDNLCSHIGKKNINSVITELKKRNFIKVIEKEIENVSDTKRLFLHLLIGADELQSICDNLKKKSPVGYKIVKYISDNGDAELSDVLAAVSTSKPTVDRLVKNGYIRYEIVTDNKTVGGSADVKKDTAPRMLNKYQQNCFDIAKKTLGNGQKNAFLLHGVTGSGKTEVYLSLIRSAMSKKLNSVLLVPEISLTPQMVGQIYERFGNNVAVLHSKLTTKQRFNEWKRIKNGEVQIAVGARSAVFAPFKEIGLIIIDEEHETTYKSEMSPRYNAVEMARFIAEKKNATLILASATPSVESYYKAKTGVFELMEMPERINKSKLPDVTVADMRAELSNGNMSIFSNILKNEISDNLKNGEQTILFLNRRGFSGFVSCRNCGYVLKCPNCNVSLTYHKSINKMVCHYCDYKTNVLNKCPSCCSSHIRFFGIGTEKIVDEVKKIFPQSKVLRMDADTTASKNGHEKIINEFKSKKADILIGTQMITKGLDFENVTLVGVVAADMSLNVDDYRASERTFDLITQVIGRAGRAKKAGRAVIQTYNPDDEVIIQSSKQNYKDFFKDEISVRRTLLYPPFSEFINVQFVSEKKDRALQVANEMHSELKSELDKLPYDDILIYNVCEAPVFKINNRYRYRFLIKTRYSKEIYDSIHEFYNKYKKNKYNVNVGIDVNPASVY